ncbi:hypothetical protein [Pseudomonas sp.]|uniref:hypothetical protein n=1 Tax=Pseudomonas sp. TaxID=306 RepID=UPI003FD8DBE0
MIIKLSPQSLPGNDELSVAKAGSILTVNGEAFDFSPMSTGSTLPRGAIRSQWFDDDVENIDGELVVTLLLPLPSNYSPEQAFPIDLVNVPDGPVVFPAPLPPGSFDEEPTEPAEEVASDE